jgi:glycosyltransferase involved in cell wall biosynthesis
MVKMSKPRLLVLSHVLPFPGDSGQQQRVSYTLRAAREIFHVTFATFAAPAVADKVKEQLSQLCDDVVLLPALYARTRAEKARHQIAGTLRALRTGLKLSNHIIGQVEFSPSRISGHLGSKDFEGVLFEYWHAAESTAVFQRRGIPCVLDMHNVLWQSYQRDLNSGNRFGRAWRLRALRKYRAQEERAWSRFDGLITINREEHKYVEKTMSNGRRLFYAPMGIDLSEWPYSWKPGRLMRLAYYGGLGSRHNQRDALRCYEGIMPEVWRRWPDAELWLIGGDPSESIRALAANPLVNVTGFVKDVQSLLSSMSVVLCPWTGTYGFRSRLIEVMSLGVPVVASSDAIYGMDLEHGKELLLGKDDSELAAHAISLLEDDSQSMAQSRCGRQAVELRYSIASTYEKLMCELNDWLKTTHNGDYHPPQS